MQGHQKIFMNEAILMKMDWIVNKIFKISKYHKLKQRKFQRIIEC